MKRRSLCLYSFIMRFTSNVNILAKLIAVDLSDDVYLVRSSVSDCILQRDAWNAARIAALHRCPVLFRL